MAINKVEANGETLIDLTNDTVTADTLVSGRTAHLASGEKVTGTFEPVTGVKGNAESAYRKGNVNLTPANIGAATSEQGAKADSAVQTIQISGTTQTKTGGTVNLPAYPTKSSLGLGNVDNTSDANKPISTAAQAALDKQQAQIDYNTNQGVKNLYRITAESQTINGVTFTVDKVAGTITANGTATAHTSFKIGDYISSILQVGNKYTLSGCPAGGNYTSTYALYVFNASTGSTVWADVGLSGGSSYVIPSDIRLSPLYILIRPGVTVSNIVFKPMIRYASIKDNTFELYAEPNYQLTQKVDKALDQTGYNMLEITANTQTINGITFTVDKAAGTITANGTATAQVAFVINSNVGLSLNYKGELWSDGSPSGSSINTYFLNYEDNNGKNVNCYTNEPILLTNTTPPATITRVLIYIRSGVTVNNLVFKPMITTAELAGVPFQPYALSNADLTQKALLKEDDNAGGYDITLDKPFRLGYGFYSISITRNGITLDQGGDIVSIKSDGIYFNGEKIGS